ncbi:MAG TPA: translational GTPase TypA [Candidatus Hydrogenedentes bacterium]|nr:translational GTPase TypA [Candidatus Hydrogenedentota bacterium]
MSFIEKVRNVAIIAHIDHGKTTLIDSIFRATRLFRENARVTERVMDNNELERERGITIRAKHCSVEWNGYRINIIDTPGHADFSGEVERILSMVDSVLLLVDANEGPMPQTRYVLMRSLRLGLRPIVIVNKVDRPMAEPMNALHKTFDLFLELGASDEQCDFAVLYGSGLHGWVVRDLDSDAREGMDALFETIVENVPPPQGNPDAPFLMQVSTIGWRDHIGRTGTGRILQGTIRKGQDINRATTQWKEGSGPSRNLGRQGHEFEVTGIFPDRVNYIWVTRGLDTVAMEEAVAGDIVTFAGPKEITIGDSIATPELENPGLPPLEIEEPTVSMLFLVNTGPFAGQDGNAATLRQIRTRLERELRTNIALRMEDAGRSDGFKVSGRGELHLAILIEEMRREGMELCVSPPEVITKLDEQGRLLEPMEELSIDVPLEHQGVVIEKVSQRKGELTHMANDGRGIVRLEFNISTRGLIGYRNEFLTDTRGLGIMASRFIGYGPWNGDIVSRSRGSMISMDTGVATSYSLENLQERGTLFVSPTEPVYAGMIVGEHARPNDLPCNPTKRKALTNHRAVGKDHSIGLDVPRRLTLDTALEWIAPGELLEVTPKAVRPRKAIIDAEARKREERRRAEAC